jgi:hypothetical protein
MSADARDRQINPCNLSDREWRRLASIAGLKSEDWGEGWLEMHRVFKGDNYITEREAVAVLRGVARRAAAAIRIQAGEKNLHEALTQAA